MRTFGKSLGRLLLSAVVVAAAIGMWKREELTRLMAVNSLFDPDKIVSNFSNMDAAFLTTPVSRGDGATIALPYGTKADLPDDVHGWIKDTHVTTLVVLKNGEIVFEDYFKGTKAEDRRIGWSLAKSYLSALVGILIKDCTIESIDVPVTQYMPALKGSAYDGASLCQVLWMSSGVLFDENYLDTKSDINRMGRVLALGGKMDTFTTELTQTFAEPGQHWQYVSIDTHVIGMVVRGATGRTIPELLSEKIISKLGVEQDLYYVTDGVGTAFVLGGLNVSARDYARFGQLFLQGGVWQGEQIIPADWIHASTTPSAPPAGPDAPASGKFYDYGYHWWVPKDATPREYLARGIYVNEPKTVVIVATSANRQFRAPGVDPANVGMLRLITNSL